MIRRIEEISMNTWPALQTVLYDGWVLRFADGYTRRANSINPIYASTIDANTKIAHCERVYSQKSLCTVFKMTEDVCPSDLDRVLEEKGYIREAETSVQTLNLESARIEVHDGVRINDRVDDSWLDGFLRLSGVDATYRGTLRSMLEQGIGDRCVAHVQNQGAVVACGLGVREENMVWLFDIIVDERLRGRGLGTKVTESILAWARMSGADVSYLQVMADNKNALALYEKMGFRELYRYWYRVDRKEAVSR